MTRLRFWLAVLDVAEYLRAPLQVYLWLVARASNATDWGPADRRARRRGSVVTDLVSRRGMVTFSTMQRLILSQTDRWVDLSYTSGVYARDRCCHCYAPTRPHAKLLRTARTNDGEHWLISIDVDLTTPEWKDFQDNLEGDRLPTLLPVGSGCLRDHPEWRFALAGLVERSL